MPPTTTSAGPTYRLLGPTEVVPAPPELDPAQRAVVDHGGGPLLVLAGPGTGKTTTLVEAVVDRIDNRGADPASVLALTFSRKAAEQLRDRVTARVGRTLSTAMCSTFHSFAYALVRRYAPADLYTGPLRLLSAPEQDVVLRELLTDAPESVRWPDSFRRALGTRGFAREVHAVLARAREKDLDGAALRALGEQHDLPEYVAAGWFLDQYLDVLDQHGATDYTDLVRRAVIEAEVHREELRRQFRHVLVDEYQDTDPAQVALLRTLAGDGGDLTVVGDPHQSIYGFRGADVRGILDFPTEFRHADGRPADVVALSTTRRFGRRLMVATQRVAHRLPLPTGLEPDVRAAFLEPTSAEGLPSGRVQVHTFDTERAEAEHLADLLRRAHLEDQVAWDQMAVLVRSGRASIPGLRRSLAAAGVPVEVAGDELPLVLDPAVGVLLDALRAVLHMDADDPDAADYVDPERAVSLLTGPLGGLDAGEIRRLGRLLRQRDKRRLDADGETGPAVHASAWLLRRALLEEGFLDGVGGPEAERARALHQLLRRGREELAGGATAEEVLWVLWAGTSWPHRLRRSVESGGAAARRAHRDLDSLVALFDAAARAEEQRDHLGVESFLATLSAQEIPADSLAEKGTRGAAVRLLTAHRAKGLEWRLVVVAHVQAERWPDLRRRTTLLRADRIGSAGLVEPPTIRQLLQEERRLFYVACTRARERLVVTAVRSPEDEGEQPSRFLDELGLEPAHTSGRPPRPLSLAGLVSELRRTVTDPAQPEGLRRAAARRLAALAAEEVRGRPLVPQADPGTWWGTRSATRSDKALREADRPVPVSASLLEAIVQCPARWFWTQEAGGIEHAHQSANLGQIVHALAERVAAGEIDAGPGEVDRLMAHVDLVWGRLSFRTPWSSKREHDRVRRALERFLEWHHANPRELVATEQRFRTVVDLDGTQVELIGYADRVEVDADGRVVVVDLKTARTAPSGPQVLANRQLALYQYAVAAGALADAEGGCSDCGGAELVQLGLLDDGPAKVQAQPELGPGSEQATGLEEELRDIASILREEAFPTRPGDHCKDCAFLALCPARSAGSVFSQ